MAEGEGRTGDALDASTKILINEYLDRKVRWFAWLFAPLGILVLGVLGWLGFRSLANLKKAVEDAALLEVKRAINTEDATKELRLVQATVARVSAVLDEYRDKIEAIPEEHKRLLDDIVQKRRNLEQADQLLAALAKTTGDRTQLVDDLVKALSRDVAPIPVGTIAAWPGSESTIPPGWRVCDGRSMSGHRDWDIAALRRSLGESAANLPDYRGYFLRGVDDPDGPGMTAAAGVDVDASARLSSTGQTVGGIVGSRQGWATGSPVNNIKESMLFGEAMGSGDPRMSVLPSDSKGSALQDRWRRSIWDRETRPVNVYVNWIIKVK